MLEREKTIFNLPIRNRNRERFFKEYYLRIAETDSPKNNTRGSNIYFLINKILNRFNPITHHLFNMI